MRNDQLELKAAFARKDIYDQSKCLLDFMSD